ncbi:hypothetical protein Tco_0826257, partial [Tanacetum coccineum]
MQLKQEVIQNDKSYVSQNAVEIPEYFVINDLKARLQDKDTTIWKEIVENASQIPSATTIAPSMFKLDLVPLPPRLLQNREAHIDYIKHTQENANILWEIVKLAKAKQPLDSELDFACKYATRIQELLVYVQDTCPNAITPSFKKIAVTPMNNVKKVRFAETITSSSKTQQVESSKTSDSNTHVLSSTGVKKPKNVKTIGSSKKAKIVESKNANHSEPNQTWGSNAIDIPSSSSLVMTGTVRFGNDQIVRIMRYGDYQLGNVVISKVYYVERLGHNLFLVGQFCDADLKVAFQKNTCFIRNLEGVDLFSGSRDTNLNTISLDDMLRSSLICLLSKTSKTRSWLWHRRLSHLNFACSLGKNKKSSHQPKVEDTNQEKLYPLHMDLCGPIRVASINRK